MISKLVYVSNDLDLVSFIEHYCFNRKIKCLAVKAKDLLASLKANTPDLLLVDFILNDTCGGSICHQVKCDPYLHDIPVALLSDYQSLNRFAPKFGCSHLLQKPLSMDTLTSLIESLQEVEIQK